MREKRKELFNDIEQFIDEQRQKTGIVPSVREIGAGLGVSAATVSRYLIEMKEKGRIGANGHRGIVTDAMRSEHTSGYERAPLMNGIPVVGGIACGVPKLAEENIEDYVNLPAALFGRGDFFILRACGDSMTGAGIDDGDFVVIRRQSTAEPGQIAVALIDDEATLKRFYPEPENHRYRLHPENPALEDIYTETCAVQGVAVHVIKALD